jgi:hypothetical protein
MWTAPWTRQGTRALAKLAADKLAALAGLAGMGIGVAASEAMSGIVSEQSARLRLRVRRRLQVASYRLRL